ncbi:MAG: 50S ribosomal protein L24 [Patescibacteria group bacterium]
MKFKVGDQVLVTGGKDKGKQGKIVKVLPLLERVVVEGMNMYVKHIKPFAGRPGDRVKRERALPTANIAIFNPETKKTDRIGYTVAKDGSKSRIFKKTGKVI